MKYASCTTSLKVRPSIRLLFGARTVSVKADQEDYTVEAAKVSLYRTLHSI